MSNKPDIKEVLEINRMKEQAKALYDEIDARVADIKAEYGADRFDYDLEEFVDENSDNPDMELMVLGVVDEMKANEIRQDAISATRGQLRFVGADPITATEKDIEFAASDARPGFCNTASDNQWKLFIREFKKWQKGQ